MKHHLPAATSCPRWPRPWRVFVIALGVLILCSCRGPETTAYDTSMLHPQVFPSLPESAYTGVAAAPAACDLPVGSTVCPPMAPPGGQPAVEMPPGPMGPWSPPGISQPWPTDEYLRDGGDRGLPAEVGDQWEVRGLELEDTIAHYDTLAGQTVVEPSNRVHVYSPRFGAVRQVTSPMGNQQAKRAADVHLPTTLVGPTTVQIVASSKQNVQADRRIGTKPPVIFHSEQGDGVVSTASRPKAFQDRFKPYENVRVIRDGVIESAEMPFLARGITAAVAWSHEQAVQVILDHQAAMADVSDQKSMSVFTVEAPPPAPKLRLAKVASTQFAEPGDEVAFTIRFDNVGNQTIGNVTIIDNLTTRLEYVPDSAECSLDAEFFTQPNEGDSLVIRCEIADPLPPGRGGVLRFRCRVR